MFLYPASQGTTCDQATTPGQTHPENHPMGPSRPRIMKRISQLSMWNGSGAEFFVIGYSESFAVHFCLKKNMYVYRIQTLYIQEDPHVHFFWRGSS